MADATATFYDSYVPGLHAGEYTLTLSQTLTGGGGAVPSATQTFLVRGPRFSIQPAWVQRAFPPANGMGQYHEYLPMLVLTEAALPWERLLDLTVDDPGKYPWMALVAFADDELQAPDTGSGPPPAGSQQNPMRTASLPLSQVVMGQTPGPPAGVLGPTLTLEDDEDPSTQVNVIDVAAGVFTSLAPSLNDLPLLAHVRQVTGVEDAKTTDQASGDGWFSALLANRFATPPSGTDAQERNIVHLVSLEGFEQCLGADAVTVPSGYQTVRMVSLYSWTFTCLPDPQVNFATLMNNLISPGSEQGTDLRLRMPLPDVLPAGTDDAVQRLQWGYVPLPYETRSGESTFAWFRGPFTPEPASAFLGVAEQDPAGGPVPQTSSEAMIYDPNTGVFDQSLAVAFQTGRSLALASQPFATALMQWRSAVHAQVDLVADRLGSPGLSSLLGAGGAGDGTGGVSSTATADDLMPLAGRDAVRRALAGALASAMAAASLPSVGSAAASGGGSSTTSTTLTTQVASATAASSTAASATRTRVTPAQLRALMQSPAVVEMIHRLSGLTTDAATDGDDPPMIPLLPVSVVNWLASTVLLYDVPFNNLVADPRLLPSESIRFFYLDPNWSAALIDGALSAGVQSSRDTALQQAVRSALHGQVAAALPQVRARLTARQAAAAQAQGTPAGFLLRSAVVSGWPGMEVRAYSAGDSTTPMTPLRLDTVSPNVMLGLYPDIPVRVEFDEPSEGLVFGTEDEGIDLRYVSGVPGATAQNFGVMLDPKVTLASADFPYRATPATNPPLVVGGAGGLMAKLAALANSAAPPVFSPAELAVQLVRVPEQMVFLPQPSSGE